MFFSEQIGLGGAGTWPGVSGAVLPAALQPGLCPLSQGSNPHPLGAPEDRWVCPGIRHILRSNVDVDGQVVHALNSDDDDALPCDRQGLGHPQTSGGGVSLRHPTPASLLSLFQGGSTQNRNGFVGSSANVPGTDSWLPQEPGLCCGPGTWTWMRPAAWKHGEERARGDTQRAQPRVSQTVTTQLQNSYFII